MDHAKTRPGARPARLTPAQIAALANISEPRWAEGDYIIYLRSHDRQAALHWVPREGGPALQLTSDPPPAGAAAYAGGLFDVSEDHVVYGTADGGLALMPLYGGPGRAVARIAGTQASAPSFSPDGTQIAFVCDDGTTADIGLLDARGRAWPRRLPTAADFVIDPTWSADGRHLLWVEWDVPYMGWDSARLMIGNPATGVQRLIMGGPEVSVSQPRPAPDGRLLAFLCDRDGWLNLWLARADGSNPRPLLVEEAEHGPPPWSSGAHTFDWTPDSREIIFTRNRDGAMTLHAVEPASGTVRDLIAPPGIYSSLHVSPDGGSLLAAYSSPATAPQLRVGDLRTGTWRVQASGAVGGSEAGAVRPETLTCMAPDGLTVPGLLYMPALAVREQAPLLVLVHGGPTGQASVAFNPMVQYFVSRGWAVLAPNARGSSGYGRAHTQALAGEWGRADMADILAGVDAVLARGDIDPARVVPIGGSAGGYTVLQLLALYPDRFKAGVSLFGISDHTTFAETTHRLEAHYLDRLIAPLPEGYAAYRERSPLFSSERMTAPLLLLQGADDRVVPPDQAQVIYDALRAQNKPVEMMIYPGEGHGWLGASTIRDYIERTDSFLRRYVLRR